MFSIVVATSELSILATRVIGALCLACSLLPLVVEAHDTPDIMRSAVVLMLTLVSGLLLFLASGNAHLLTPGGRAVLLGLPALWAALYGTLTLVGFF